MEVSILHVIVKIKIFIQESIQVKFLTGNGAISFVVPLDLFCTFTSILSEPVANVGGVVMVLKIGEEALEFFFGFDGIVFGERKHVRSAFGTALRAVDGQEYRKRGFVGLVLRVPRVATAMSAGRILHVWQGIRQSEGSVVILGIAHICHGRIGGVLFVGVVGWLRIVLFVGGSLVCPGLGCGCWLRVGVAEWEP
jgi:hypothetical protein